MLMLASLDTESQDKVPKPLYNFGVSVVLLLFSGSKKTKSGESTPNVSAFFLFCALS